MATTPDNSERKFKVDARALLSLGRESIKDHTTALIELVKNSYDADAANVEIEIITAGPLAANFIRVADDGVGMSSEDIDGKWLRIGFSEKRNHKISAKGRRETGEKGIGRLSSDRLGAVLELRTKRASESPVGVKVDWDDFDTDGTELGAVLVAELEDPKPSVTKRNGDEKLKTGTEILIRALRQRWSQDDISALESELSTLVPVKGGKGRFDIWLRAHESADFKKMESAFEGQAELLFSGSIGAKGVLSYSITSRPKAGARNRDIVKSGKIPWDQLVPSALGGSFSLGKVEVRLAFFLRASVSLSGALTLSKLREYLDADGGVRIYRDGVRVKPYGDPSHAEGDWLGLAKRKTTNPAGAARADFRISANQLVGTVLIGRDTNPTLTDSSAREGLIHSEAFSALKSAVFGCVEVLEGAYHQVFLEKKAAAANTQITQSSQLPEMVSDIKSTLSELSKEFVEASKSTGAARASSAASLLKESAEKLESVAEQFARAKVEIEELASQNIIYRGLATVGISSAVFGHETESALAQAKLSATTAYRFLTLKNPNVAEALPELVKAEKAMSKVELWGQFAISRMKKDKRRRTKVDISRLVGGVVREIRPLFTASKIELEETIDKGIETRAFPMDIESLVLNLLTNAFHAARNAPKNRKIIVAMNLIGRTGDQTARLVVADSGPGIAKEHLSRIWEPLFSTKVDEKGRAIGTGLGLTIVQSIAKEMGATTLALPRGPLGGASFQIEFPVRA